MKKLTKHQAMVVGAYTGFLCGSFSDLHDYIEKKLGRPVFTHEMGIEEVRKEIEQAAKADFLAICNDSSVSK